MDIDDLTLGQIKEISLFCGNKSTGAKQDPPFEVGKQYFIRTVTNYYVGTCEKLFESSIRLNNASWIPDTGRFSGAMKTGAFNECEPYPGGVNVWFGSIVDHIDFEGDLPTEQK